MEPIQKQYQVFVSSTYEDLRDERTEVFKELLRRNYIPRGMEQMPASDRLVMSAIEPMIDEVDYYIVILGGRYGSAPESEEISFTEQEYDYAVKLGLPVLAFLHRDPDELSGTRLDRGDVAMARLARFREKVRARTVIGYWATKDELASSVSFALDAAVRERPRPGWIRGDDVPERLAEKVEAILEPADDLGIAAISGHGNAPPGRLGPALARARQIRIASTSAVRLIENYQDQGVVEALTHGASIRILVPHEDSQFVRDVEGTESEHRSRRGKISQELEDLPDRMLESLGRAKVLLQRGRGEALGTVAIGRFTTQLRQSLILCDEEWGWLTILLPPLRGPQTPSLELRGSGSDSLLSRSVDHFDRLWRTVEENEDVTNIES